MRLGWEIAEGRKERDERGTAGGFALEIRSIISIVGAGAGEKRDLSRRSFNVQPIVSGKSRPAFNVSCYASVNKYRYKRTILTVKDAAAISSNLPSYNYRCLKIRNFVDILLNIVHAGVESKYWKAGSILGPV